MLAFLRNWFRERSAEPPTGEASLRAAVAGRRQAEAGLRQSEEQFGQLVAGVRDYAIFLLDRHGHVLSWNEGAERIKGYTAEEIVGQHFARFYPHEAVERGWPDEELRRAVAEGRFEDEGLRVRKDGTTFWANVVITALRGGGGEVRGFLKITRDLTARKQAEEGLRRSEERFRLLVEGVQDYAIFLLDPQGHVASWNAGAERLKGYKADEIIGQHFARFYPQDAIDQGWPALELKVARAEGRFEDEGWRVRKDGTPFWANVVITALHDEAGNFVGFSKITRDLTERKRSEENARRLAEEAAARRVAEEHARLIQEQRERLHVTLASIGDAVISTDAEGRVEFLNPVAQELVGWGNEEACRCPLADVFRIVNEDTRQPVENPALRALNEGIVVGLANHTVLISKDGRERPIDDSAAPIKDAQGRVVGCVLVFRDITERKRNEERLREQQEWLRVTLASIGDAVIATDTEGRVTFLNPVAEQLTGWTQAEAQGRPLGTVFRITNEQTGQPVENPVAQVLRDGAIVGLGNHTVLIARDGRERPIDDSAAPIRDAAGRLLGVVLTFRDVTEHRRAEAALRHSEAESRRLLAFHEAVMANMGEGLYAVDTQGRVTYMNPAAEDFFGWKRTELVGRRMHDLTHYKHPDGRPFPIEECAGFRVLKEQKPLRDYDDVFIRKDGSFFPAVYSSSPLVTEGKVSGLVVVFRDMTERNETEAQVREQEQRTRTILESITDAFCALDRDWRFAYVNRQAEVLMGRSRDDLLGKNHWEEYPDTLGTDLERHYRRAVAENVTATFEFFYPPHDRWYEVHAYPSPDGLSIYFRDVSERKAAEMALRESEQRFRQLADAMPQVVWTAGPDGTIDYLNRRWTEFTGLPQTVGNDAWGQILHPDDARPAKERWATSLGSGAPFEMELRLLDRRQQTYRWNLIRTVAVNDEVGKVIRWFGTSTDIHAQKRAEESSRFLALASAALAGVVDCESTLQKVANLAVPYFADWSAVDVARGGSLRRLAVAHQDAAKVELVQGLMRDYPPDPQAPVGAFAVLRTGQPEIVSEITDAMLVREARDERHLHLIRSLGLKSYVCVPLIVSGKALGVLTFATAESGRRYAEADLALAMDLAHRAAVAVENTRLYEALRENDRRKDEFLATLAHELRNPLAPIRTSLQILKMPRADAATVERSRQMMERQVHHLVRLVDDLLDVSRVMRGKIELKRERVELASVVARAVETAQPLLDAQGHELSLDLPPDSLPLEADPVRLAQVVGNLLTNAAKYTERGGHVWLTARREGERAVLRVRDTGIGIAPEMLPRIFDLFVQADHAATRSQGGLGIGLTLVKNLVEMHHGTIEAHSPGLGKGSEFVAHLPLAVVAQGGETAHGEAQPRQETLAAGRRVLVVDDNQDAADSLATMLRLQGHEVRVAHDGPTALAAAQGYRPEVVFLDIGMPGMDGCEVARRLRQNADQQGVVLVAVTGWGTHEDRRRTAASGFDHHLVKPVEPKVLAELLADRRLRRR